MPSLSQFTIYTSSDASGPGPITGQVSSLINVFDACLVNGYSGKAAAGWTKPFANSGNLGTWKQGAGCGYSMVMDDSGANTGGPHEAFISGWKTLTGIGAGSGQFPTAAQFAPFGYVTARKSATNDSTPRGWILFADASTFYIMIQTGDAAGVYYDFSFGDFYSLQGTSDANRCFIQGRTTINGATRGSQTGIGNGSLDYNYSPRDEGALGSAAMPGFFIADNAAGSGGSQASHYRFGDVAKQITNFALYGNIPAPNPYDNSFYLSPIYVVDPSGGIRGIMRGLYHLCHAVSNFADGQTFGGANDFLGKTFQVVLTAENNGMLCFETSATINTN